MTEPDAPRLVALGATCDAIVTTAAIGRAALADLLARDVEPGPVILDRRTARVAFLVPPRRAATPTPGRPRDLPRRLGTGTWIAFPPTPGSKDARMTWLVAPDRHRWRTTPDEDVEVAIARVTQASDAPTDARADRCDHVPPSRHEDDDPDLRRSA